MTTIKVGRSTRDGLRVLTSERGVTMDAALKELLEEAARERCFAEVRCAMGAHPSDETYLKELREWESEAWNQQSRLSRIKCGGRFPILLSGEGNPDAVRSSLCPMNDSIGR